MGDKKSQTYGSYPDNTARVAAFQASPRRRFYVRKIAEKRTRCRAAIKIAAASLHIAVKRNKS